MTQSTFISVVVFSAGLVLTATQALAWHLTLPPAFGPVAVLGATVTGFAIGRVARELAERLTT